ncbi:MAG TPA: DUF4332 domain-containing protein [Anaerolineae bacterium]|nr:DUF4332 domain-containing protein [Caldilineae bacterium]HID35085.1 DUF4332 domain-containing protein [Anaerolineae bacterium]
MSSHDLQQIKGIGPTYAQKLADAGIVTLQDLARTTPEQLHEIVHARGRMANYALWIQQARELVAASGEAPEEAAPPTEEAPVERTEEAKEADDELQAELQDLVKELNDLAAELKRLAPQFQPPPYIPQRMKTLLAENLDRFAPETVKNLQESLEGATLDDFKDFETWKGVWFTINYLIKLEASERGRVLAERLAHLPGVSTLEDLKEMLKDTPPEEFLNPETWKGVWFLINYELKHVTSDLKKRLVGDATQEEDGWDDEAWDDDWNEEDWE